MRMSILLFIIGAVALVVGVGAIGYGIPINEFSLGNTLIIAGSAGAVGGLIVMGLGAVVSLLQRIAVALATREAIRPGAASDFAEARGGRAAPAMGRIPFPPRPKPEAVVREQPAEAPAAAAAISPEVPEGHPAFSHAPSLPNPEAPPMRVEEEVSLLPSYPAAAPGPAPASTERDERAAAPTAASPAPPVNDGGADTTRREPTLDWRSMSSAAMSETDYFEALWPPEPKPTEPAGGGDVEPRSSEPPPEPAGVPTAQGEPEMPQPVETSEPRAVAILKSGVVDGMGYTLYVDGSIEAELPQGTLRFASINELREHLEKNS